MTKPRKGFQITETFENLCTTSDDHTNREQKMENTWFAIRSCQIFMVLFEQAGRAAEESQQSNSRAAAEQRQAAAAGSRATAEQRQAAAGSRAAAELQQSSRRAAAEQQQSSGRAATEQRQGALGWTNLVPAAPGAIFRNFSTCVKM